MPFDDKVKAIVLNIVFFYIILCTWINKTIFNISSEVFNVLYVFGYISVFMLAIMICDGNLKKQRISKIFLFFYFCFSFTFALAALMTERIGSLILGMTYMVSLPLLMKTCCSAEKKQLIIESLVNGIIINFLIIIVISLFSVNANEQLQYSGIIQNPNSFGMFCITAATSFLYKCYCYKNYFYYLGLGSTLLAVFIAQSRTALICLIFNVVILGGYLLISRKIKCVRIGHVIAFIAGIVLSFVMIFYLSPLIGGYDKLADVSDEKKTFESNMPAEDSSLNMKDEQESEEYTENEISLDERNFGRITHGITDSGDILSGRLEIWNAYVKNIGISPHSDEDLPMLNGETIEFSAHNTYIHLAYCFGVICGVFYLITNLTLGVTIIKRLLVDRGTSTFIISFIAIIDYGMFTLVETSYDIIGNVICLVHWFITLIFVVPRKENISVDSSTFCSNK